MISIVLASFNNHKIREFGLIAPDFTFTSPGIYNLSEDDSFEETGESFFENAFGKALHIHNLIYQKTGKQIPVLADDSGICVTALDGAPGIYSARFGKEEPQGPTNDAERTEYLLNKMQGIEDRRVYYVCSLVCVLGSDRFWACQETWEGHLTQTISQGTTGFGYDPIVQIPPSMLPVAEMPEAEKAVISHRAKAFYGIKNQLLTLKN